MCCWLQVMKVPLGQGNDRAWGGWGKGAGQGVGEGIQ